MSKGKLAHAECWDAAAAAPCAGLVYLNPVSVSRSTGLLKPPAVVGASPWCSVPYARRARRGRPFGMQDLVGLHEQLFLP